MILQFLSRKKLTIIGPPEGLRSWDLDDLKSKNLLANDSSRLLSYLNMLLLSLKYS